MDRMAWLFIRRIGLLVGTFLSFVSTPGTAAPNQESASCQFAQLQTLSIDAPSELLQHSITRQTIDDVVALLSQSFRHARIGVNLPAAQVRIELPEIDPAIEARPSRFTQAVKYANLNYPDHDYEWSSACRQRTLELALKTPSHAGASFALYGLLQEKLGFRFPHPRESIIPSYSRWPLANEWKLEARARFDKKGFHLHTMHPIEVADSILDASDPRAQERIREYLDWLVRNQQNLFQFVLLRTIDRDRWIEHARRFVEYGRSRGIVMGVNVTLAMFQQKAWRAVNMLRLPSSYEAQIRKNLAWLAQAPWDFVGVDFATGEYFPDSKPVTDRLRAALAREITKTLGLRLYHKVHVIPEGDDIPEIVQNSGVQVHSTMCYSITEEKAPVYGFNNQRFVLARARNEVKRRETWYFPESSYWVTFDTDVPLFLLPYLDSRWSDLHTVHQLGVNSHLTFTSGWEWGYWLFDWSIARWSWEYRENGKPRKDDPLQTLRDLFPGPEVAKLFKQALDTQNHFLKELELMRYITPSTPMDEAPGIGHKPFQPAPPFKYSDLPRADAEKREWVRAHAIQPLEEFASATERIVARLKPALASALGAGQNETTQHLAQELIRGIEITGLRARHRSLTLSALLANHEPVAPYFPRSEARQLLNKAEKLRENALILVREQERGYRYPVDAIAAKRKDFTAYHFGYLYPVHDLHFWKREERQVVSKRFDVFYMNIWNFRRILGLEP